MNKEYRNNIDYILNEGKIENISLENLDILKNIINDDKLSEKIYNEFKTNFKESFEDEYLMKTQDLIYRLNLFVNKILIDKYNIKNLEDIKIIVDQALNDGLDLYSAVSYDNSDIEILDNFEYIINDVGIKI